MLISYWPNVAGLNDGCMFAKKLPDIMTAGIHIYNLHQRRGALVTNGHFRVFLLSASNVQPQKWPLN